MQKLFVLSLFIFCLNIISNAQSLPGINTSNYNGVLGTFSNPSNVLGQSKWDVHLFGLNVAGANENSKVKLSDIGSDDFLKSKLIGTSGYNNANVNLEVPLLGFLIGLNKKTSIAFTTRARVFVNADHIDARLLNAITDEGNDANYPYIFVPGNPSLVTSSAITDYAFTWANEIMDKGPHYIKGGLVVKYVSGVGNLNATTDIAGMLNNDDKGSYISPGTGNVDMKGGGKAFIDDFNAGQLLKFEGGGLGFDLGFSYEYRPESWKNGDTKTEMKVHGNMPYQFKFGASLMDIGKVKFVPDTGKSKSYAVHIPASEKFYLDNLEGVDFEDLGSVFDAYPQYFTATGVKTEEYKVSLPTTLRLNVDYNIGKGFFVNLDALISMKSEGSMDHIRAYNTYSLTPRFEGNKLGVFLPVSVSQLSGFNVGAALHLGPLYIGSGSILSLITGGSKQADAFFGFRFGGLK